MTSASTTERRTRVNRAFIVKETGSWHCEQLDVLELEFLIIILHKCYYVELCKQIENVNKQQQNPSQTGKQADR